MTHKKKSLDSARDRNEKKVTFLFLLCPKEKFWINCHRIANLVVSRISDISRSPCESYRYKEKFLGSGRSECFTQCKNCSLREIKLPKDEKRHN